MEVHDTTIEEVTDLEEEVDDNLHHAIQTCFEHHLVFPPEGALVQTVCGILARCRYNGKRCPDCDKYLKGRDITVSPEEVRHLGCWKCGRRGP